MAHTVEPCLKVLRNLWRDLARQRLAMVLILLPALLGLSPNAMAQEYFLAPHAPLYPQSREECNALREEWAALFKRMGELHQACLDNNRSRDCPSDVATGCSCVSCARYHSPQSQFPQRDSDIEACNRKVREIEERDRREQEENREREREHQREERHREQERRDARRQAREDEMSQFREEREKMWERNAERYSQAGSLSSTARDLMDASAGQVSSAGAHASSSIGGTMGRLELAMAEKSTTNRDVSALGSDLLAGLGKAAELASPFVPSLSRLKNVLGLTAIPMGLTQNVFRANFAALDQLQRLDFAAATRADTDRIFAGHIRNSFGPAAVLSVVLEQPIDAVQSSLLERIGVPAEIIEAYDYATDTGEWVDGTVDAWNSQTPPPTMVRGDLCSDWTRRPMVEGCAP